jgi:drug/metabolite transporter (DMT)-like permease
MKFTIMGAATPTVWPLYGTTEATVAALADGAIAAMLVGAVANRLHGAYLLACGQFAVCAVGSGLPALALESLSIAGLATAAAAIAYTGILSVGVGFTLQVVGQRHAPPADAAILLSSETLFAAAFGALLMGDRLGAAGWAGCGLILAGILLVQGKSLLSRRVARPAQASRPSAS